MQANPRPAALPQFQEPAATQQLAASHQTQAVDGQVCEVQHDQAALEQLVYRQVGHRAVPQLQQLEVQACDLSRLPPLVLAEAPAVGLICSHLCTALLSTTKQLLQDDLLLVGVQAKGWGGGLWSGGGGTGAGMQEGKQASSCQLQDLSRCSTVLIPGLGKQQWCSNRHQCCHLTSRQRKQKQVLKLGLPEDSVPTAVLKPQPPPPHDKVECNTVQTFAHHARQLCGQFGCPNQNQ